ncbi:hypothetical protein K8R66_00840 [bacterium]|nr:hypothetical protein [bacterium]
MTKFEFVHENNRKLGLVSTAINSSKNELLNSPYNYLHILKKQAKKCHLDLGVLNQKVIEKIKADSGGVLAENLKKYVNLNSKWN